MKTTTNILTTILTFCKHLHKDVY